ncbi:hypothetical protein CYLTODRAFT_413692 [Cylindrobasidium torrendii FP15055 ss-10]|uniref:Uncharacterized protein n=1 Tax=Cylindrobasidium torrendii FP15055 ss-10 TaxID=1314674 RepID=A0A0D7AZW8_9AGAR|nr:hypothetical protein CYLTODRAFT_413692 [Cylindrobasidium torrendii FP15055 ss-10]
MVCLWLRLLILSLPTDAKLASFIAWQYLQPGCFFRLEDSVHTLYIPDRKPYGLFHTISKMMYEPALQRSVGSAAVAHGSVSREGIFTIQSQRFHVHFHNGPNAQSIILAKWPWFRWCTSQDGGPTSTYESYMLESQHIPGNIRGSDNSRLGCRNGKFTAFVGLVARVPEWPWSESEYRSSQGFDVESCTLMWMYPPTCDGYDEAQTASSLVGGLVGIPEEA